MARKTDEERLAEIEAAIAQGQKRRQLLVSRIDKQRRTEYTRKCFVIGDVVQRFGNLEALRPLLDEHVKDAKDRTLLGLESN